MNMLDHQDSDPETKHLKTTINRKFRILTKPELTLVLEENTDQGYLEED